MNSIKFKKFFFITLFILFSFTMVTAVPLDHSPTLISAQSQMIAAQNAFNIGLFEIAQRLYSRLLEKTTNPNEKQLIATQLAFTLINQSKYTEALKTLSKLPNQNDPIIQLLTSIAAFPTNPDLSKKIIETLPHRQLPKNYLPWLYITQALIAEHNQNFKEAKNYLQESRALAHSEALKTHIDILLFRLEILTKKVTEGLKLTLEKKLEKNKKISLPLLKQYAIVLDKLGEKNQAIDLLKSTLNSISSKDINEIDPINFLIGLIATPESDQGRRALENIIQRKYNFELSKNALSLLTQTINNSNATSYMKFLTSFINSSQKHPLIDSLLLHRAHVALFLDQPDIAESDAIRLQEDFPGSSLIPQSMRLLAYIAWTSSPPHYRTAADILTKLSEKTKDPSEQTQLTRLSADAFFLNHDYNLAAKIYMSLLENPSSELHKGPILYQLILSLINQNDLNSAEISLNKFRHDVLVDSASLWRAEWNLVNAFKNQGQIQQAFSHIHKLLQSSSLTEIPLDLKLRFMWLHAQLSLESGNPKDTPPLIDSLLELLGSPNSENLGALQTDLIASHALLLKAQALFELHKEKEALEIISSLRKTYPQSKPTILSYLIEAHYYSSISNPTKAQQELINLADNFPDNEYTPIALYEAALNADSRSLKTSYQEALSLLERLISSYPGSPFTYNARFKQADILRKLGNFTDAQLIYENLLKQYPNHREKYKTKLASLDAHLAQSTNSSTILCEIASQYFTLLDLPSLPSTLRAEAGFKSGFAYIKANQPKKAEETFWLTINTLLLDPSLHNQLTEQSRYWIARSIFELGGLFEKALQFKEANEVYEFILSHNLPGAALAKSKIK